MRDEDIDTSDISEWTEEEARRATLRACGQPITFSEMLVISADAELVSWFANADDEIREEACAALRSVMERHR